MLVCCPLVSADYDANDAERGEQLRVALRELRPILESKGLIGCIEPLGFPISTIRFKADAIAAIHDIGGEGTFRLVHDTFHHRGAAETEMYASMTGLVHISGVEDPGISFDEMLDAHRLFVGLGGSWLCLFLFVQMKGVLMEKPLEAAWDPAK